MDRLLPSFCCTFMETYAASLIIKVNFIPNTSEWVSVTTTTAYSGWHLRSPEEAAECALFAFPPLSAESRSTTSSRPVRSVKMSATGSGGCGPGPGPTSGTGSGASNPRKFSEKIALHTQRQAEETAAFQEVMMDITSTRVSLRRRQEEESCRRKRGLVWACQAPS